MPKEKLKDRARDELFSHINRCGVLEADADDTRTWMDETIEYIAERYPDLSGADLSELHAVGMRFCRPAIPHGNETSPTLSEARESIDEETEDANAA